MKISIENSPAKREPELKLRLEQDEARVALQGKCNDGEWLNILFVCYDGIRRDTSAQDTGLPTDSIGRVIVINGG